MQETKADRRRKLLEQMTEHRNELKTLGVTLATGNRVVLHFAGVYEEFWFHQDEPPVRTENGIPLEATDEQVLFAIATNVCAAVRAGYGPEVRRKERKKTAPAPVRNRRRSRDAKALETARSTTLYRTHLERESFFALLRLNGETLELRIGDHQHSLIYLHTTAKHTSGGAWISRAWFSFICCFGEQLFEAVFKGYKSTNPQKERRQQNPTPRRDPRQKQFIL